MCDNIGWHEIVPISCIMPSHLQLQSDFPTDTEQFYQIWLSTKVDSSMLEQFQNKHDIEKLEPTAQNRLCNNNKKHENMSQAKLSQVIFYFSQT